MTLCSLLTGLFKKTFFSLLSKMMMSDEWVIVSYMIGTIYIRVRGGGGEKERRERERGGEIALDNWRKQPDL